ncbi:hypothetical protein [Streptomyces hydrogenans]|uniref:hypothetical protein n=1 Tax=Streptomyces hydrogenans TaxID=1873719 RepID=UPI00380F5F3E
MTAPAETSVPALPLAEGPLSRVELARRTGPSSTAVTKAARPLIDDGHLHELPPGHTAPGAGRPVNRLAVTADRESFVGGKVSADALYGAVCDLRAGLRATADRPLGEDRGPVAVSALIRELVDELLDARTEFRDRTRRLGIAVSGDVDRAAGRVRYSVLPTGEGLETYDLFGEHIKDSCAEHCFKAAARCPLTLRPLPWEEWARGAAVLGVQALFP